jgi:hypothetical protein
MSTLAGFCLLAFAVLIVGCADSAGSNRPSAYRGGQYYDDAVHAGDLERR